MVLAVPCPPKCLLYWHRNNHSLFDYYKEDLFAVSVVDAKLPQSLVSFMEKYWLDLGLQFFFPLSHIFAA